MGNINRGSEWRKWDLHIHTPETKLSPDFKLDSDEDVWDKYCELIENSDVDVFGITDYFSVENYFNFIEKFKTKYPQSNKVFFPNIEFRLEVSVNKMGEEVNLHVIFSNIVSQDKLNEFLSKLETNISVNQVLLTCEKLKTKNHFEKAAIDYKNLKLVLSKIFGNEKLFIIVAASNNQGLRADNKSPRKLNINDEIDKVCDSFFGNSTNTQYFLDDNRYEPDENGFIEKSKKCPVFSGSDSHSFTSLINKLGKSYKKIDANGKICDYSEITWIKAEKTFEGLQQVLNEPENRVFIGEYPVVLERIKEFPSKYIDKIEIDQVDGYDEKDGIWFKKQMAKINPELTVIIGNKGKGKSAITDVIGLCGNSHRQKDFSFLSTIKFKKKNLAKNFESKLSWFDKNIITKNLNDFIDENSIEKVKYIPQNFFEDLCNNIDDDKAFRKEINDVVFRHIDETERLNKNSFDEFVDEKKTTIYNQIKNLKEEITEVNKEVIEKQIKIAKNNIENLKSRLKEKENELENLKKNAPTKNYDENLIGDLEENPNFKKANSLTLEISSLKEIEKNSLERLTSINSDILKLDQLKDRIKSEEFSINKFIDDETIILKEFEIEADKVFFQKIKFDIKDIINKILLLEKEKLIIEINLGKVKYDEQAHLGLNIDVKNLINDKLITLINEQTLLFAGLEGNMKLFQEFIKKEKEWEEKKVILIGDENGKSLDSINYFKKEIERCEKDYVVDITELKKKRISLSISIYEKKKEIIDIYLSLKNNVEKIIENNSDRIKEYNINVDATFEMNSFSSNFLDFLDKTIAGEFRGTNESERKIKDLIDSKDINEMESFKEFLLEIESKFEDNADKNQPPFNQLRQNKVPLDFYDFIFGLDFLKEKYELKLDNKSIEQLSPGERGAALIVFYLLLDNNDIPLIIDQPEDNLDNHSVYKILVPFIKDAKKRRQIIIVTHNPNLAIVSDAELVIHVNIDKENKNTFSFNSGAIENKKINNTIVDILEGTEPAFIKRKDKYGF